VEPQDRGLNFGLKGFKSGYPVCRALLLLVKTMLPKPSEMTATGGIPSELLTKSEVAKRLRISDRKIELDHHFPVIRYDGSVRYSWPEVFSYVYNKSQNKEG
jgi:hypothetical protein